MGIIAKYKFNQNVYENFIPEFNVEFTNYTITDEIDTDGFTIRTIESDSLPTLMKFGATTQTDREKSLLEVYECNTEGVTNMSSMFYNCSSLTSLDVSNFNTSQVNSMSYMFQSCSSLTSLDLSSFDTSEVTNMGFMFNGCSLLTSLDVSNFNTNKTIIMNSMFQNCSKLTSLDISNFNTGNVTIMGGMFINCSSLTSLDVSNFNTENVTNMNGMFHDCSSLTSLDVSNFNTENVTSMQYMFYNCSSLTSLDVLNFKTEKVTNMQQMFHNCSSLASLDVSNFNTSKITDMTYMFNNCSSLTSLNLSNFNTSNVTNMNGMFAGCSLLISLDVSNFNTSQVTNMSGMFHICSSLTYLDISNFNTEKVTDISYMFRDCSSLTSLDISNFNTEKVTNTHVMFQYCHNLTNIGAIYCDSLTINKISDLITTDTTIWYSDAKLEDLTKKSNITYKEYKMNILESDEEINLRRIGDIYDELNLETGELTQRIGEVVLDGSESWFVGAEQGDFYIYTIIPYLDQNYPIISDKIPTSFRELCKGCLSIYSYDWENAICFMPINATDKNNAILELQSYGDIVFQYIKKEKSVKTVNLKNKPSIDWQGDIYLHLENNTLYPQLDCEIESINYYEIPKLKANTLYTLRYVGEPTQCIFGGLTYKTENNMILTSGSSDNLLYFDKEVKKVVLIEGDVRDRNFDYFEGIESLGAVEIITHKSDMSIFSKIQIPPHIQLHKLPDGTCDELDIKTGILTRKTEFIILDGSNGNVTHSETYDLIAFQDILYPINNNFVAIYDRKKIPNFGVTTFVGNFRFVITNASKLGVSDTISAKEFLNSNPIKLLYQLTTPTTEKLILNYNNSCNYGVILPRGTSDNYNVTTNEYKQNLDFIPIDGSIAFDTATIKDTTVKFSVAISKFEVDTTNVRGSDGVYCDNNLFKYEASDNDYEHGYIENDTTLHIYVNKSRLSSYDQVGFQLYLTSNPFNLYYAMKTPIISYVNYEDLDPEKASWEMLDCTEDGSITIESGNMDKTLLLDCLDYIAPTKNRFEIDLLKANTQYTVYAEGVSGRIQLNFGGNIVNFTSGNIYTSGETQLVEFYTDNEIKNLIIIEGDTRTETIDFFEGLKSSENITIISSNAPYVFGKGGKIQ